MKKEMIEAVNKKIYDQFPEVNGVRPKVQKQTNSSGNTKSTPTYLLIYSGKVSVSGNRTMSRIIRVVVNERGTILKISTSK